MNGLMLVVGFLLRSMNISRGLTGDELLVLGVALKAPGQLIQALMDKDVYPPFTYIVLHYWVKLSQSPVWIRMYFVLFGMGACAMVYFIAKEYAGRKTANIALAIATFSPLFIFGSQYVRSYMDSAFFMLASSFFMLRIMNGRDVPQNRIGYIVSTVASFYTFYFSALLAAAQFVYAMVFGRRRVAWIATFIICAALFAPWIPRAAGQLGNSSSIPYDWSVAGFNMGGLKLGLYARSIGALFGLDPYFLVFREGAFRCFSRPLLWSGFVVSATSLLFFSVYLYRSLRERFDPRHRMLWFIPALAILPMVFAWLLASSFNIMSTTKYFIALHGLFIVAVALVIENIFRKSRVFGAIVSAAILTVFLSRLPAVLSGEFDPDNVAAFLNAKAKSGIVLSKASSPAGAAVRSVSLDGLFVLDEKGRGYVMADTGRWRSLTYSIKPFRSVLFYRVYGNDEIFGANGIVDRWLKEQGYEVKSVNKFRNADVVEYGK